MDIAKTTDYNVIEIRCRMARFGGGLSVILCLMAGVYMVEWFYQFIYTLLHIGHFQSIKTAVRNVSLMRR